VHLDILRQDLRFAARSLRRTPGFAITAVLVVALGVGANTAVFSLADFVFMRPLPFREPAQLVKLWQHTPGDGRNEASPLNFRDWRERTRSFDGMAAYTLRHQNLVGSGEPRELQAAITMPDVFPVLGVSPLVGRAFTRDDLQSGPCVVLSEGLWKSRFGSDTRVVGKSIQLSGVAHTVMGVMPATFQFPYPSVEIWSSLDFLSTDFEDRTDTYLEVIARLKQDVSRERARDDLAAVSARLAEQYPDANKGIGVLMLDLHAIPQRQRLLVLALCGAALCILLLSCANLASLLLARAAYRAHELAVRSALGAGRDRLVRQLVTESLTLSLIGGIIGVVAAAALLPLLSLLVPSSLPVAGHATLDLRALAIALGLTLVTGLAIGLAPALRAGRAGALGALRNDSRTGGGRTQRLRAALVVVEVAASVVLLVTSGLLIRAIWRIQSVDPGFHAQHVLAVRTALPVGDYGITAKRAQYYDRILEPLRATPGVESAAFTSGLPMVFRGGIWDATVPGEDPASDRDNSVSLRFVTQDYFAAMGVPLVRGRDIQASDASGALPVAVVSESFVRRHWPGQDPLGRQFEIADSVRTIVGVVGDMRVRGLEWPSEPQVYLPSGQVRDSSIVSYFPKELVVRFASPMTVEGLVPVIRRLVAAADPQQPISRIRQLTEILSDETAPRATQVRLLGALTALALIIAGIGLHGLLAFTVSMRWRELGIRRALGAEVGHVVGLIVREGLTLVAIGLAIGVAVGYAIGRGMGALLMDVHPADPTTLAAAAALCLLTAAVGFVRPALNAARVDPLVAMRAE
jgi:predicted permease